MSISHYFVRPTNGADIAGQGTTHMTAYKTTQFALNDIGGTHGRNTVDGDQINICASVLEGPDVLAGPLSLATYGIPTAVAPLILRGYTAIANDGGRGAFTLTNNNGLWAAAYDYVSMLELNVTGAVSVLAYLFSLGSYCYIRSCGFIAGGYSSGPTIASGVLIGNHTSGFGNQGLRLVSGLCFGNYLQSSSGTSPALQVMGIAHVFNNIVHLNATGKMGIDVGVQISDAIGNIVYNEAAGTNMGIKIGDSSGLQLGMAINNIVCGFSGIGGVGISSGVLNAQSAGHNAFWNNTTNEYFGHSLIDNLGDDVALTANPFTNAAGGDFSLTAAAQAALRSAGWPSSYLGANTDPHITIGAVQYGEGGGSGAIRRAMRILGG